MLQRTNRKSNATHFGTRRSKYNARKVTIDGIVFASGHEGARYTELKLLQRAGKITGLELQPKFDFKIEGKKVFLYKADFAYFEGDKRIIEDAKGFKTREYKLKKKIIEAAYHLQITEV